MTTKEAAEKLGLSLKRVQTWAKSNKQKKGRDYDLTNADVDKIRSRMGKRGKHLTGGAE